MMTPTPRGPRRWRLRTPATILRMDPHGVLGLPPGATPEDVTATYRALAKEWHPDRGGGRAAERRMAEINAAYDLLRAQDWTARTRRRAAPPARAARRRAPGSRPRSAARSATSCSACSSPTRTVWLVTPTTTWASPQALLAASDRRLLWLLDDAVTGRVQTLRFAAIEAAEHSLRRPRRRVATLRVRARNGRRFAFGELQPGDRRRARPADRRGRRGARRRPDPSGRAASPAGAPMSDDRHDRDERDRRHRPPARLVGGGSGAGPRIATRIATPSTAPIWRVVALIPLPIPSCAGPRSRTQTATIVAKPSPTPTPISSCAGSHSDRNAGSVPTCVASHTPAAALISAPGSTNRRGSTRSVYRAARIAAARRSRAARARSPGRRAARSSPTPA